MKLIQDDISKTSGKVTVIEQNQANLSTPVLSATVSQGSSGPGLGSVTNVSVATANGVSGSVANPTTTPVITLILGAITPTSVTDTSLSSGGVVFAGPGGLLTQDVPNFFYMPIGYGGNPNLELGPRASNPLDASFEFYVTSGVTAHFHNVNTTQSVTGGVTIGLMYIPAGAVVTSGNRVGSLEFGGSIDTSDDVGTGAAIRVYTTQTYSSTTIGSKMVFQTVPNGSAVLATALTIDQDQSAQFTSSVGTGTYLVANLPSGILGRRAFVTNALAPAFGSTVVGGGAVGVPVYFDGSNWKVG
jgi:hypothetical protein